MDNIDKTALHPTYLQLYEAIGEDDELLFAIWDRMSGQQVNFPEHMFAKESTEKLLSKMVADGFEVDVAEFSKRYGFSRRWVREALKKFEK
jgi:Mor family transcriptional regulator